MNLGILLSNAARKWNEIVHKGRTSTLVEPICWTDHAI